LAAWLHRAACINRTVDSTKVLTCNQLAGPGPGSEPQPGLDGSIRAQDLAQKITTKIVANNTGIDPNQEMLYNRESSHGHILVAITYMECSPQLA
jgi:hypothetical protein